VNGNGAYEGEMKEISLFENALLAAVPTQPDARLGEALVPRLAEVARASTIEAETQATRRGIASGSGAARRRPRSRLALVARVGLAVAMIPLVLAGLAFAGVTVPGPARSAFDTVGITLPNQPHSDRHGTGAGNNSEKGSGSTATETPKSGAQSKGKSAVAHQHALEQRAKAHGKAVGHTRGKAIGLTGSTPPGHSKQTGPPAHSNAGGSSATHTTHTPPIKPTRGNANGHSK
jgi:hypothetical protein